MQDEQAQRGRPSETATDNDDERDAAARIQRAWRERKATLLDSGVRWEDAATHARTQVLPVSVTRYTARPSEVKHRC